MCVDENEAMTQRTKSAKGDESPEERTTMWYSSREKNAHLQKWSNKCTTEEPCANEMSDESNEKAAARHLD